MPKKQSSKLVAWELGGQEDMPLEPAASDRAWMDQTHLRYAYRCLPLVIANQAGWIIRNPIDFSARWNGGNQLGDLKLTFPRGSNENRIRSHFGHGILTFTIPYLFRTPPRINLWVKGPANWIKDGVQALEGVVETDWSDATFTMNWAVTRKNHTIRFERGEPICMIVPVPRGLAEELAPERQALESDAEQFARYDNWRESRRIFNEALQRQDPVTVQRGWQRDYMLGMAADGQAVNEHQTRLRIRPFQKVELPARPKRTGKPKP
jgi:hypothetical protein